MTIFNSYVKLPEDRLDYIRSSNVHALLGQLQEVSYPFFAHPKLRSRESSEPISCDLIEVRFFQTKKTNMSVWGCIGISWDWMVVNRYNIYRYTVQWYMYTFTVNQNFRPESYIGFLGALVIFLGILETICLWKWVRMTILDFHGTFEVLDIWFLPPFSKPSKTCVFALRRCVYSPKRFF